MVITVFLLQPVSSFREAVNSMMVRGDCSHSRFISFHSLSDRFTCIVSPPWYTSVYLVF